MFRWQIKYKNINITKNLFLSKYRNIFSVVKQTTQRNRAQAHTTHLHISAQEKLGNNAKQRTRRIRKLCVDFIWMPKYLFAFDSYYFDVLLPTPIITYTHRPVKYCAAINACTRACSNVSICTGIAISIAGFNWRHAKLFYNLK